MFSVLTILKSHKSVLLISLVTSEYLILTFFKGVLFYGENEGKIFISNKLFEKLIFSSLNRSNSKTVNVSI